MLSIGGPCSLLICNKNKTRSRLPLPSHLPSAAPVREAALLARLLRSWSNSERPTGQCKRRWRCCEPRCRRCDSPRRISYQQVLGSGRASKLNRSRVSNTPRSKWLAYTLRITKRCSNNTSTCPPLHPCPRHSSRCSLAPMRRHSKLNSTNSLSQNKKR